MKCSNMELSDFPERKDETHMIAPCVKRYTLEFIQRFNDAERQRQMRKTPGLIAVLQRSRLVMRP